LANISGGGGTAHKEMCCFDIKCPSYILIGMRQTAKKKKNCKERGKEMDSSIWTVIPIPY
jgi:hypothetical protein